MNLQVYSMIGYKKLNRFRWGIKKFCYKLVGQTFFHKKEGMIWGNILLKMAHHSFFFFCTGNTFAFFHSEKNVPLSRQILKLCSKAENNESLRNFCIRTLIMSVTFICIIVCYYIGNIGSSNWDWWKRFGCLYIDCCRTFTCIVDQSTLLSKKIVK